MASAICHIWRRNNPILLAHLRKQTPDIAPTDSVMPGRRVPLCTDALHLALQIRIVRRPCCRSWRQWPDNGIVWFSQRHDSTKQAFRIVHLRSEPQESWKKHCLDTETIEHRHPGERRLSL